MDYLENAPTCPPGATGPRLDLLARRIRSDVEAELGKHSLRPLHLVTMTVLAASGEQSQARLTQSMHVADTTMVSVLNELEVSGLTVRRRARQDRRRHTVSLTTNGERCLVEMNENLADAERRLLAPLDRQDRMTLYALLLQVCIAVDE
jgi:DNA-binding MarR family transcriptional regulator